MTAMEKRRTSEKLGLLDQYLHALIRRFYLRPSMNGAAAGLSSSEFFALDLVGRNGKCTMTELAKGCGLMLSSMTGVVDRLVDKEYVERVGDEEDRRRVWVELSKKGQKVYQELLEAEMEMIISIMDSLEPDEQDMLLRVLGKAIASAPR